MTSTGSTTLPRSAQRPGGRLRVVALAVALVLSALSLSAAKATPPTTAASASAADQTAASQALSMQSLHPASYTVTLLTGDRVHHSGDGVVTATAAPRPDGSQVPIEIDGRSGPSTANALTALPADVVPLIESAAVDQGLFDILYLADAGYTDTATARLPVMIEFAAGLDAATIRRQAQALPASTLTAVQAKTKTAQVDVNLRHAQAFWAGLTENATPNWPSGSALQLADGIISVWLKGHKVASAKDQTQPRTDQPLHTVTYTVKAPDNAPYGLAGVSVKPTLTGIVGAAASERFNAFDKKCLDANPCTTIQAKIAVPAGVYMFHDSPDYLHDLWETVFVTNPELVVADDVTLDVDLNGAQRIVIDAPQPLSRNLQGSIAQRRTLPDGTEIYNGSLFGANIVPRAMNVVPRGIPTASATMGSYIFSSQFMMTAPELDMSVQSPKRFKLHAIYSNSEPDSHWRFPSRRQTVEVADANLGRQEDFASGDFAGKLALVHVHLAGDGRGCSVGPEQLRNALQAGAVGLLMDPLTEHPTTGGKGICNLPVGASGAGGYHPEIDGPLVPMASIPRAEAQALLDMLESGPVRVAITDGGITPYRFFLKFYENGRIPDTLHYTVTDEQLMAIDSAYHGDPTQPPLALPPYPADPPLAVTQCFSGRRLDDDALILGNGYTGRAPWSGRVFVGPVSPDIAFRRSTGVVDERGLPACVWASKISAPSEHGARGTEHWNSRPVAVGAAPAPSLAEAHSARGFREEFAICAGCRQGDTFYPFMYNTYPDLRIYDPNFRGWTPDAVRLYDEEGNELPQTLIGTIPTYKLPAQHGRYRLAIVDEVPSHFPWHPSVSHTSWEFSSSEPAVDQVPPGVLCAGILIGISDPCRPDPLVFLRYDPELSLDNRAAAPGTHRMEVTAYHQAADAPAISGLKVWTSVDSGETWDSARVTPIRGGDGERTFEAIAVYPSLGQTTGSVALKAEAWDADGNRVEQVIEDAFRLWDRSARDRGNPGENTIS